MKKNILLSSGIESDFFIKFAQKQPSGAGHYKLILEIEYLGEIKVFKHTTRDMEFIDSLSEIEDSIEKYECIYLHMLPHIEESIVEWIELID